MPYHTELQASATPFPCGITHFPCSPPVRLPVTSSIGSQPLVLQMCCAQLFVRRLSFLPLLLTGPPHPTLPLPL